MPETASNPIARGGRDYWRQSRKPLASLLFVLPLLAIYEAGVLWLGPQAIRNGAEVWLQQLLGWMGFGGYLILPLLIIFILLAWHHTTRENWRVSALVLYTMAAECTVLSVLLVTIAQLHAGLLTVCGLGKPHAPPPELAWGIGRVAKWFLSDLVRFFGAGIYEELLFRLMLLPLVITALGAVVKSRRSAIIGGVLLTSLAFSGAHYIGPHGESLTTYTFVFRFVAGAVFAVLFVYRGFGIAAGTHALYDIFVGFPSP